MNLSFFSHFFLDGFYFSFEPGGYLFSTNNIFIDFPGTWSSPGFTYMFGSKLPDTSGRGARDEIWGKECSLDNNLRNSH